MVLVTSYPCYIVVSLAVWGSGFRTNGVNTYCLISCWDGVGRRSSRDDVGLKGSKEPNSIWNGDFKMSDRNSKVKIPYTAE